MLNKDCLLHGRRCAILEIQLFVFIVNIITSVLNCKLGVNSAFLLTSILAEASEKDPIDAAFLYIEIITLLR